MTNRKSSDLRKNHQSPTVMYFEKFGDGPPPAIAKFVANTAQVKDLEAMLLERIEQNKPVKDWEAFAKPLLERWEARH